MMTRRGFFGFVGAAVLGAAIALRSQESPLARVFDDALRWPEALRRGDLFTIEGVYAVNPMTYHHTDRLQPFVVAEDVAAGAFVDEDAIYPKIQPSGMYQTVSHWPAPGANIHVIYGMP